jgi:hypothetical protein
MKKRMLLGVRRHTVGVPHFIWGRQVEGNARHNSERLAFMSPEHHAVRNFAVTELPRLEQPLAPETIAQRLDLPLERVLAILADLEKHLTFLFRNAQGAVVWAYPVTVEPTPHRVTFSSGEKLYAA